MFVYRVVEYHQRREDLLLDLANVLLHVNYLCSATWYSISPAINQTLYQFTLVNSHLIGRWVVLRM